MSFLTSTFAQASVITYTDRTLFEAAVGAVVVEDFESFSNGESVPSLFDGFGTFDTLDLPTVFYGTWLEEGGVEGGALIPEPRFESNSIKIDFNSPVFGIGGDLFDDRDGNPFVNILSLSVITVSNNLLV